MLYNLMNGNSLELLKTLEDNSIDAIVTDPPYGLSQHSQGDIVNALTAWLAGEEYTHGKKGFMGKAWDSFVPSPMLFKECYRVLKHGGHILCFAGSRTQDLMSLSIRLAGFEMRDACLWLYGCLSEDTEILTSKGWVRYHKNIDRSTILCYNKDSDSFEWQKPTDSFYYENKHTAYSIKSDFTDQIVSRNHRVIVEREGKLLFVEAEALKRQESVPFLESLQCLPNTLYGTYKGTSNEEQNLFKKMYGGDNSQSNQVEVCNKRKASTDERMPCLQENVLPKGTIKEQAESCLLKTMQRRLKGGGVEIARTQGACFMETGERTGIERTNDWFDKSKLERGIDLSESQGSICHTENKVCKMSDRIHINGTKRRLCNGTSLDCCNGSTETAHKNGGGASYQPRCNRQQVGELNALQNECGTQTVRTRKAYNTTLATVTPIEYGGNVWCVTVPTGAFVARRNGKIFITGNSGFPKGQNIAKGIDGVLGKQGISIKTSGDDGRKATFQSGGRGENFEKHLQYEPSDQAKQWEGWNTNLKPAYDPIIMARKPLDGTVVNNVLKHGVGGLNVDACRVGSEQRHNPSNFNQPNKTACAYMTQGRETQGRETQGRYPANIILDGSDSVEALFPYAKCSANKIGQINGGTFGTGKSILYNQKGSEGSASRYFYHAKASKADRDEGVNGLNPHPTVKPTQLMRYLVKLVTPQGGLVLDPFMGSGSTGKACMLEGMRFIGMDLSEEYVKIAESRIEHASQKMSLLNYEEID